jgi:hypothetical protein
MADNMPSANGKIDPSWFDDEGKIHEYELDYHREQFKESKRSTVIFCDHLEKLGYMKDTSSILDIGAGMGAPLHFMSTRWPDVTLRGVDNDRELVRVGSQLLARLGSPVQLEEGDLQHLGPRYTGKFDGVVSLQTLSWLPEFEAPLQKILDLKPRWLGLTSLFYDGPVGCDLNIMEYFGQDMQFERRHTYRVYSLDLVKKQLRENGFDDISAFSFEIDIDLPRPENRLMRTYTERLDNGRRLQLSGPVLMPWYFVFARRSNR